MRLGKKAEGSAEWLRALYKPFMQLVLVMLLVFIPMLALVNMITDANHYQKIFFSRDIALLVDAMKVKQPSSMVDFGYQSTSYFTVELTRDEVSVYDQTEKNIVGSGEMSNYRYINDDYYPVRFGLLKPDYTEKMSVEEKRKMELYPRFCADKLVEMKDNCGFDKSFGRIDNVAVVFEGDKHPSYNSFDNLKLSVPIKLNQKLEFNDLVLIFKVNNELDKLKVTVPNKSIYSLNFVEKTKQLNIVKSDDLPKSTLVVKFEGKGPEIEDAVLSAINVLKGEFGE